MDEENGSIFSLSTLQCHLMEELRNENSENVEIIDLHQRLIEGTADKGFSTVNRLLVLEGKLYVSSNSPIKTILLYELHSSPMGGHARSQKTYMKLAEMFYWNNIRKEVKFFVQQCAICQYTKYLPTKPSGLLQPLPIPNTAWSEITTDFIIGLPQSKGYTLILVVIDRLTKYAHFGSLPTSFFYSNCG